MATTNLQELKQRVHAYQANHYAYAHLLITFMLIFVCSHNVFLLSLCILRTFMIFHDTCHMSFFKNNHHNYIVSLCLEPFVLYDAKSWKDGHNHHHIVHGNSALIDYTKTVITVKEYQNLSWFYAWIYRIGRSPLLFFPLSPLYIFGIQHLIDIRKNDKIFFIIKMIILYTCIYTCTNIPLRTFMMAQYMTAIYGIMLFHLQHQVNPGFYKEFDMKDTHMRDYANYHGASLLYIPWCLKWATFGIEYHHIHHLDTRVPSYLLEEAYRDYDKDNVYTVYPLQAIKSLFYTLYDEKTEKYITFPLAQYFGID